jgi:tetratricopeptide (TPR) repeat protein
MLTTPDLTPLAHVRSADDVRAVLAQAEAALATTPPSDRILVYHQLGCAAFALSDVRPGALDAFTAMRDLALAQGRTALAALAHSRLSRSYDILGRRWMARREAEAAVRLAREAGDERVLAHALGSLGQFYKETGDNPQAHSLYQQMHAIGTALADDEVLLHATLGLAVSLPMAEADQAIRHNQAALALAEKLADPLAVIVCYNNLADWLIITGDYAGAIAMREANLRRCAALDYKLGTVRSLLGLGRAHSMLGDVDGAWATLRQALPLALDIGDAEGEIVGYLNIAHLYARQGDTPRARDYYARARTQSEAAPDSACYHFAVRALDQVAAGQVPLPAVLPPRPATPDNIRAAPAQFKYGYAGGHIIGG